MIPVILRARGYRLYTQDGRRLIDLWLNGGAAILGHTPPNVLREIKNTASRGLYAPFPHFTEGRYLKALAKLFPGYVFRLYMDSQKSSRGGAETRRSQREEKDLRIQLWRPYTNPDKPFEIKEGLDLFIPVLPFSPCVLAAKTESLLAQFPPGDTLSPVLLAAAARGLYDLLAAPQRAKPVMPKVFKALQNSPWKREGIYLSLKEKPTNAEWETLFKKFLDAGFLLPPDPSQPVILPGEMSDGESAKLAAALSC
uniref:Uncharacterized protein n=1 Tax=uncultured bacterium contig00056 TaxID=1181540 RepID=A0A806JYY4_9BACT|nr:hypothetical protein [uncultured bacterium contig00056]